MDLNGPLIDLSRFAIPVTDTKVSGAYYGAMLGLPAQAGASEDETQWFLCANNVLLGLTAAGPGVRCGGAEIHIRVDHFEEIFVRLEAGRKVEPDPGGAREIITRDPDGNLLRIGEGRGISHRMESRTRVTGDKLLVEEEIRLPGAPETIWSALTDPSLLSAWLCGGPVEIEPKTDGRLDLTFPHLGRDHTAWKCRILDFLPHARLRFQEQKLNLEVTFDLAPAGGDDETLFRLTQTPLPVSDLAEDPGRVAQNLGLSWRRILRRLALLLEDELEGDMDEGSHGEEHGDEYTLPPLGSNRPE